MINIDNNLLDVLVGSLLGRGSLQGEPGMPFYRERRQSYFKGYLEWKKTRWGPSAWVEDSSTKASCFLQTVPSKALAAWYYMFYASGEYRIPISIDRFVSERSLAIWFLDQCTQANSAQNWPGLYLKATDRQSREKGRHILKRFGLVGDFKSKSKGKIKIEFKGENGINAANFLNLVAPFVPESMRDILSGFNIGWHHTKWLQQTIAERRVVQYLMHIHKTLAAEGRLQSEVELMARAGVPAVHMARLLRLSVYEVERQLKKHPAYAHSREWRKQYVEEIRNSRSVVI